jgi:hypothetical protein
MSKAVRVELPIVESRSDYSFSLLARVVSAGERRSKLEERRREDILI